jgi:1-hydroxy-2-methyl-2-(E)-butenyl 4-diphosphate synthase
MEAVEHVEKVRVNPGNYADKKRFAVREYSDADYERELQRLHEAFSPLVRRSRELGRSMRIGTNHGSLSDRIMNRYGDTPLGMVESALEFLRIAESHGFRQIVLSMKASNPKVMIQAYRLLVERMDREDMHYPLHLGVTEAGDGEDGRIKGAIGIGSLLLDGLGDTIRVSLTEDSVYEIPVARAIADKAMSLWRVAASFLVLDLAPSITPADVEALLSKAKGSIVLLRAFTRTDGPELAIWASLARRTGHFLAVDASPESYEALAGTLASLGDTGLIATWSGDPTAGNGHPVGAYRRIVQALRLAGSKAPVWIRNTAHTAIRGDNSFLSRLIEASFLTGSLLCDGIGDLVSIETEPDPVRATRLSYNVLQGAGARVSKAEFVACPSCGRTLFDLQRPPSGSGPRPGT